MKIVEKTSKTFVVVSNLLEQCVFTFYFTQGMYEKRVKNDRKSFEIPALLSCNQENPEWKI